VEHVAEQSLSLVAAHVLAVADGDAGALLPSMLEGMEAKIGHGCGVLLLKRAKDAALLMEFVQRFIFMCHGVFSFPLS
jgi:hypothetical protein